MAYEKRDAAFDAWGREEYGEEMWSRRHEALPLRALVKAFNAGWAARKKAVDYAIDPAVSRDD